MQNTLLHIPQIRALDELCDDLRAVLPEPLLDKVLNAHFDVIERFRVQVEITEYLTEKLVKVADKLVTAS